MLASSFLSAGTPQAASRNPDTEHRRQRSSHLFNTKGHIVILRFLTVIALATLCSPVRSDIIVDVQDATITAGGHRLCGCADQFNGN